MEVKGKVHKVLPTEQITDKFKKRVLVVTDPEEKYPQFLPVEFTQDRVSLLDNVKEGDDVVVAINLRGREANNGNFYSSIEGWKITKEGSSAPRTQTQEEAFESDGGNLPF